MSGAPQSQIVAGTLRKTFFSKKFTIEYFLQNRKIEKFENEIDPDTSREIEMFFISREIDPDTSLSLNCVNILNIFIFRNRNSFNKI